MASMLVRYGLTSPLLRAWFASPYMGTKNARASTAWPVSLTTILKNASGTATRTSPGSPIQFLEASVNTGPVTIQTAVRDDLATQHTRRKWLVEATYDGEGNRAEVPEE
jgi:hypothetical protein